MTNHQDKELSNEQIMRAALQAIAEESEDEMTRECAARALASAPAPSAAPSPVAQPINTDDMNDIVLRGLAELNEQQAGDLLNEMAEAAPVAQTSGDDLDFVPTEHRTVADMANTGFSLMEAIKRHRPDFHWNESPSEIVRVLIDEIDELQVSQLANIAKAEPSIRDHARVLVKMLEARSDFYELVQLLGFDPKLVRREDGSADLALLKDSLRTRDELIALAAAPAAIDVRDAALSNYVCGDCGAPLREGFVCDKCEGWSAVTPEEFAATQQSPSGKYDDVLRPFFSMMEAELHANSGKGDRPGWLSMPREVALLEIYYHVAKLQKAAKDNDASLIREHAADVANMSMMLADVCGVLPVQSPPQGQADAEFEILQDDSPVASAFGPRDKAAREAIHYANQYAADGPIQIVEVSRRPIDLQTLTSYAEVTP